MRRRSGHSRFFPSTRYRSLSVDISNQPSASLRRAISAPHSVMRLSMSVTCAPSSRHSMMLARGVSRGMKMCASRPARAAYAASAPPALPALGTASLVAAKIFRHGYGDGHVARFKESDFCLFFLNKKCIKAPLTELSYRLLSPASNDQIYEKPSLL